MMDYQFKDIILESEINDVKELLKKNDLIYETNVTKTIGIYDKHTLVATGSIDHNVIKMIAVHPDYQSQNLSAKILSHLLFDLEAHHVEHYFLFTKPENKKIFANFSLHQIIEIDNIVLYENKEQNITNNLTSIAQDLPKKQSTRGCIVMNLNPMTLGHLYLIEHATRLNDDVIIFLVETDASIISYETRFKILKKTISHLKNVYVIPSTHYMISRATFPTYFLKEPAKMEAYTNLDISIFKNYFMPIFKIDKRYVGQEPLDPLTNSYNKTMEKLLINHIEIIDRKEINNKVISASYIRDLAYKKDYKAIKQLVPKATYKYLISKKGRDLFNV